MSGMLSGRMILQEHDFHRKANRMSKYANLINESLSWFNKNITGKIFPRLSKGAEKNIFEPFRQGYSSGREGGFKYSRGDPHSLDLPSSIGSILGHADRFSTEIVPKIHEIPHVRAGVDIAAGIGSSLAGIGLGTAIGTPFGLGAAGGTIGGVIGGGVGAAAGEGVRGASMGITHLTNLANNLAMNIRDTNKMQQYRDKVQ